MNEFIERYQLCLGFQYRALLEPAGTAKSRCEMIVEKCLTEEKEMKAVKDSTSS